jgi:hypothetical protein
MARAVFGFFTTLSKGDLKGNFRVFVQLLNTLPDPAIVAAHIPRIGRKGMKDIETPGKTPVAGFQLPAKNS